MRDIAQHQVNVGGGESRRPDQLVYTGVLMMDREGFLSTPGREPANQYAVYRMVIQRVLDDTELLPSLPSISLKIRSALTAESTTVDSLAALIAKDPALSALLIKTAASPLYRRAVAPKTLSEVVALLGFSNTHSLVMLHSMRSLVALNNKTAKQLFTHTWKRLVLKTSLASFFAKHLRGPSVDHAQMASLLTEVGSLAVLSALVDLPQTPDTNTYFELCRRYSKSLGSVLLSKWNVDPEYVRVLKQCGDWQATEGEGLSLLDTVNLALYYTVMFSVKTPSLPPLENLAAYQKLSSTQRQSSRPNWLTLVVNNKAEIQQIIQSFR